MTDDTKEKPLPPRALVRRRATVAVIVVVVLLALGTARAIFADIANNKQVNAVTQEGMKNYVTVVRPTHQSEDGNVSLPATLRGDTESPIYARATGYVLHWYADIGARVKQGQLLADLDTPEIDQELLQARAQLQQAMAAADLAKTSADRWQKLRQRDAVSQQELDDRVGSNKQAIANVAAARANVQRLEQLEAFKRIVAPFTGVLTQRNIDVGDLITAGNAASRPLFAIAQADPLRVYVSVPQTYSPQVKLGQQVTIRQAELPTTTFKGVISHIAGAIDVPTRSLQIEIRLPNPDGKLIPGAYVQVTLPMTSQGLLIVPGNTLLFRTEGPALAVVDSDHRVKLHPVKVNRDLGKTLEIGSGIGPDDDIVVNPGDALADGDIVQVQTPKDSGAKNGPQRGGA